MYGGMGPGQDPFMHAYSPNQTPHFDKEGHERTHRRVDEIRERRQRMRREEEARNMLPPTSPLMDFMIVGSVLVSTICGPFMIHAWWNA